MIIIVIAEIDKVVLVAFVGKVRNMRALFRTALRSRGWSTPFATLPRRMACWDLVMYTTTLYAAGSV